MSPLRLGTRRSLLATTQSEWVADRLRSAGHDVVLVEVTTDGDRSDAPIAGPHGLGTGVFVSALRAALAEGEIDLAVHSLKDLPVAGTESDTLGTADTVVAAVPQREDPRDVLVARDGLTLGELPPGARVGTGSPRRAAQLHALGLGLAPVAVRGNVDTRLALVADRRVDAVVLARAGLARLGRLDAVTETLDPIQVLPAPGQGALAVECRATDRDLAQVLCGLDDADTRAGVVAERAVLAGLQAGCSAPVGVLAEVVEGDDGPELSVRAVVAALDGSDTLRRSLTGSVADPAGLGHRLAALLMQDGAGDLAALGALTPIHPTYDSTARERTQQGSTHGHPAPANLPEATP